MKELIRFIEFAMRAPYAGAKPHEKRTGVWLKQAGFKEYFPQPHGECNPPDWEVNLGDKVLKIECKTSRKAEIMWGHTPPGKDTLYVFSSNKYNSTMVFFGQDVCSAAMRAVLRDKIKSSRGVMTSTPNRHGFAISNRPVVVQRGGGKKTDFFQTRKRLETLALMRANKL